MTAAQGQNFPQISAPFVNNEGIITSAWRQFLQTLWTRTGGTQPSNTFAPGMVQMYAGLSIPGGWLKCDGSAVSRSEFLALFGAIGTIWGAGDGTSTFNVPNLTDKFAIGAGVSPILGGSGGNANVTLNVANLAPHSHGVTDPGHIHTVTDPGHYHTDATPASNVTAGAASGGAVAGNTGTSTTGISVDSSATGITIQDTGTATPFSIIPPYSAVYYIIKT